LCSSSRTPKLPFQQWGGGRRALAASLKFFLGRIVCRPADPQSRRKVPTGFRAIRFPFVPCFGISAKMDVFYFRGLAHWRLGFLWRSSGDWPFVNRDYGGVTSANTSQSFCTIQQMAFFLFAAAGGEHRAPAKKPRAQSTARPADVLCLLNCFQGRETREHEMQPKVFPYCAMAVASGTGRDGSWAAG